MNRFILRVSFLSGSHHSSAGFPLVHAGAFLSGCWGRHTGFHPPAGWNCCERNLGPNAIRSHMTGSLSWSSCKEEWWSLILGDEWVYFSLYVAQIQCNDAILHKERLDATTTKLYHLSRSLFSCGIYSNSKSIFICIFQYWFIKSWYYKCTALTLLTFFSNKIWPHVRQQQGGASLKPLVSLWVEIWLHFLFKKTRKAKTWTKAGQNVQNRGYNWNTKETPQISETIKWDSKTTGKGIYLKIIIHKKLCMIWLNEHLRFLYIIYTDIHLFFLFRVLLSWLDTNHTV